MAVYKYLREFWQSDERKEELRKRMVEWRKDPATIRVERPMRLDRARSVGYKAKQGFIVVRQRVIRGGRQRPRIKKGRRSKASRQRKIVGKSYAVIAEERAVKKFSNMTVLNSYKLGQDGKYAYFEIILVDPEHPNIIKDSSLKNMADKKGRVQRGLTHQGRRSRGQKAKGKGHKKAFPSKNANKGRAN